jgi:hypothetical protein
MMYLNDAQMAGTGAVGFCDPETQTIGVVGSQSNDSMQDTFLHEVFHAIVHVMDLKETETEENYVRRLATGLCTVWDNNPKEFRWWSWLSSVSTRSTAATAAAAATATTATTTIPTATATI